MPRLARICPAGSGIPRRSGTKHTAHLVLARILARPAAADAERRRRFGPDSVYPLKPGVRGVRGGGGGGPRGRARPGALIVSDGGAGSASERVADWHCGCCVVCSPDYEIEYRVQICIGGLINRGRKWMVRWPRGINELLGGGKGQYKINGWEQRGKKNMRRMRRMQECLSIQMTGSLGLCQQPTAGKWHRKALVGPDSRSG